MIAAATLLAVTAGACGSDDGGSTSYRTTREGQDPPDTRAPDTRAPRTDPTTPGTIVLPTFPTSSTADVPASTGAPASTLPSDGAITITDTWFADDSYGGVDWGVVYESSAGDASAFVPVEARLLDADGKVLATSTDTISLLLPGAGAHAGYEYDLEGTVAAIEVTIGAGDAAEFDASGTLTVGDLAVDDGTGDTIGTITSTYADDLDDAIVAAVWRDDAGEVTGITDDYVRLLLADGVTLFSLVPPPAATGTPAEVFVTPRRSSLRTATPDASLMIDEQWFSGDPDDGYTWGAIVANEGTTAWSGAYLTAKFLDADGRLVAADDAYFGTLRPGDNAVLTYVWSAPAPASRMEVTLAHGGTATEPATGELTVSDVGIDTSGSYPTLTATVSSSFTEELSYPEVIFLWRDDAGTVVYATSTYTDEIPAGGSVALDTTLYDRDAPTTPPTETHWSG